MLVNSQMYSILNASKSQVMATCEINPMQKDVLFQNI